LTEFISAKNVEMDLNQSLPMEICLNANLAQETVEYVKAEIVPIVVRVSGH
jgi:hypothetical protein